MQPELKCGDLVEVLPEFSGFYDAVVGKRGKVIGMVMDLVIVGQIYIIDFGEHISDEFPWQACAIAERFLKRLDIK